MTRFKIAGKIVFFEPEHSKSRIKSSQYREVKKMLAEKTRSGKPNDLDTLYTTEAPLKNCSVCVIVCMCVCVCD